MFARFGKKRYIVRQEKTMMEAQQTATPATPEAVWAILRELAASTAAEQRDTARAIKELTESQKEMDFTPLGAHS